MKLISKMKSKFTTIMACTVLAALAAGVIAVTAQTPPTQNLLRFVSYDGKPPAGVYADKGSIWVDASSNKYWIKVNASGTDGDYRALNLNTIGDVVTGTIALVGGSATVANSVFSSTSRGFTSVVTNVPAVNVAISFSGTTMTLTSGTSTDARVVTYGVFHQ